MRCYFIDVANRAYRVRVIRDPENQVRKVIMCNTCSKIGNIADVRT